MKLKVKLKKWGNSLGLRIPYQIVDSLKIAENSQVNLMVVGDRLIIEKEDIQPSLDEILDSIPDGFEYPDDVAEFVNGESVGRELI